MAEDKPKTISVYHPATKPGDIFSIDEQAYKMVTFDYGAIEQKLMGMTWTNAEPPQYWTDSKGFKHIIPQDFWGYPKNRPYSVNITPRTVATLNSVKAMAAYLVSQNAIVEAIKYTRQQMLWGLHESKTFVDDVRSGLIYVSFGAMLEAEKTWQSLVASGNVQPLLQWNTSKQQWEEKPGQKPGESKPYTITTKTNPYIMKTGTLPGIINKDDKSNQDFEYGPDRVKYIKNVVIAEMTHGGAAKGWLESARDLLDFAHRKGYTKLQPKQAIEIWKQVCDYMGMSE